MMATATDAASGTITSRAIFLENHNEWVSCDTDDADQTSLTSKLHLEKLSLPQLREQARQLGQASTGSKKDLLERLFSHEPPGEYGWYHHTYRHPPCQDIVYYCCIFKGRSRTRQRKKSRCQHSVRGDKAVRVKSAVLEP